ncbi:uncharacterized protein K452DRAFT_207681, partial [Aplosporella prunicola CBS 121167]
YDPLRLRPIAISIETKTGDGPEETANVQLAVWVGAQFTRLRQLAKLPELFALPLVFVNGSEWYFLFAQQNAVGNILWIGSTMTLKGIYTLIATLRVLLAWVAKEYFPWFVENIL